MSIYFNIPENDVFFRSLENVDVFKKKFFFFFHTLNSHPMAIL